MTKIITKTNNPLLFFIPLVTPRFTGTRRSHQQHVTLDKSVQLGPEHNALLQQFSVHQLSEGWQQGAQFLTYHN